MSTAAEHYLEGERLLNEAVSWDGDERQARTDMVVIAVAQAHLTAALVGATLAVRAAMFGREDDDDMARMGGNPRKIVEHTEWVVARDDPQTCIRCKHVHYPRVPKPNPQNTSPQWSYCEADCGCTLLHTAGRTSR